MAEVNEPAQSYFGDVDESGVDRSLIRAMLRLPPLERLLRMERTAREARILNEYGRRARKAGADSDR
jgi:tRNA A-37 threonylcarbamoyl transferase component Bud32